MTRVAWASVVLMFTSCSASTDGEQLRKPSTSPSLSGPTAPAFPPSPPSTTRITIVGDIMLGRRVIAPAAALLPLSRRLASASVTLGNLESTLSTAGPPQQGGDSFAARPSVVEVLARAGFDGVSLANNHTGDFGETALLETVDLLRDGPVPGFGAGRNLRDASRPLVVTRNGVRFAVVGFNAIGETPRATRSTPGALSLRMPPRTGPLNEDDLAHVLGLVRRLDRRVDVVIVLPHWGTQYTHVAMTQTQQGVLLDATFRGAQLRRVELVPYVIGPDFAPRIVDGAVARDILGDVRRHSP